MENQPVYGYFRLQDLLQVPTDGFPLTVFIRREVEVISLLQGVFQLLDLLFLFGRDDVERVECFVHVNAQIGPRLTFELLGYIFFTGGKISDVSDARLDLVVGTQEFRDGSRFCW